MCVCEVDDDGGCAGDLTARLVVIVLSLQGAGGEGRRWIRAKATPQECLARYQMLEQGAHCTVWTGTMYAGLAQACNQKLALPGR